MMSGRARDGAGDIGSIVKNTGKPGARSVLALILLLPLLLAFVTYPAVAEITGTTYTSPNFGYTVTWQLPWYATDDTTDGNGFDVLGLADDRSMVYFSGGHSNASSPNEIIADYSDQFTFASEWADFRQLDSSQCPVAATANSAAACYAGNQTFSDGTQVPVGVFLQAWNFENGLDVLMEGYVELADFTAYLSKWQQFGIYPPGAAVPTATAGGCDSFVENGITFCFDPNLPERDRSDITEAIRLGQQVIEHYFANPDLTGVRVNGFSTVSTDGSESLATTLDRSVAVYAGSHVWQSIAPIERIQTMVHEFFHVYQNTMTSESDTFVPLWFTEGTAEAAGYLAAAQLGVTTQEELYDLAAYSLTEFPVSGTLETLRPSGSMNADAYPLAYIAIQYLLGSRGLSISAIGDFYTQIADGASFDQAFESVFGSTVAQFTADFDAWLPTLKNVTELPADFWPTDGTTQPAPVAIRSAPAQADPNQQILIVAGTEPLTDCTGTFQFGSDTLNRQTFSNGNGELFWLVTIPSDAPAGPAKVTLSCGSTPVSTQISIT